MRLLNMKRMYSLSYLINFGRISEFFLVQIINLYTYFVKIVNFLISIVTKVLFYNKIIIELVMSIFTTSATFTTFINTYSVCTCLSQTSLVDAINSDSIGSQLNISGSWYTKLVDATFSRFSTGFWHSKLLTEFSSVEDIKLHL